MGMGMSSIPPPPRGQSEPPARAAETNAGRRPRFLLVALVVALLFGAGGWTDGCGRLAFYRGQQEPQTVIETVSDGDDRARSQALYERFVDTADNARGRAVPIAAATWVLGAALLLLAARGMGGRGNTRSALMQVVTAQAALVILSYVLLRDVWGAEADWQYETAIMVQRDRAPPEQFPQIVAMLHGMRRWAPAGWLAIRSFASLLVLVALTRPRARAYFDTPDDPPLSDQQP